MDQKDGTASAIAASPSRVDVDAALAPLRDSDYTIYLTIPAAVGQIAVVNGRWARCSVPSPTPVTARGMVSFFQVTHARTFCCYQTDLLCVLWAQGQSYSRCNASLERLVRL